MSQTRETTPGGGRLRHDRGRDRRHPGRQDGDRRRRRRSGERGRLHHGGREGDARGDQLHGHARPRDRLHAGDRRAAGRAADPADGRRRTTRVTATAFTVSIDARGVTTTGTSAHDRAATVRAIVRPGRCDRRTSTCPATSSRCGAEGGVLHRAGHTEAAVDLASLAGLYPAGGDLRGDAPRRHHGAAARADAVAREHGLKIISIADLIEYRRTREGLVVAVAEATIPTPHGDVPARTRTRARSTGARTSPWCSATSATARTSSSACTPSA